MCSVLQVGGKDHVHCLLPPLESLATVEETIVRDKVRNRAGEVIKYKLKAYDNKQRPTILYLFGYV